MSRALNTPDLVKAEPRQRVEAAVLALGYTPHFGGRALASNRTNTIGAVIPTMENAIFARGLQAMEEALGDMSQGGLQRVEVLQTCLGLGFTGGRTPGEVAGMIERAGERLGGRMDADPMARVCPETYEHVDTSDLIQPAGRSVIGIGVALVVLILVVVVGNAVIYKNVSGELRSALRGIERAIGSE